jgi:hypothetical protein
MTHVFRPRCCGIWLTVVLTAAAACSDSPGEPTPSNPLAGLVSKAAVDSTGNGVNQPLSPQGSGSVRGTVLAPSAPGAGNDSLNTATRIAGVVIRIYPVIGSPDVASPTLGPLQATVTTDANGRFQTPVIDGTQGWHVLTFTPPAGSGYQAVWSRTQFWTQSADHPWWVTLPRLP